MSEAEYRLNLRLIATINEILDEAQRRFARGNLSIGEYSELVGEFLMNLNSIRE